VFACAHGKQGTYDLIRALLEAALKPGFDTRNLVPHTTPPLSAF
jgi:hypothetical protein